MEELYIVKITTEGSLMGGWKYLPHSCGFLTGDLKTNPYTHGVTHVLVRDFFRDNVTVG